MSNSIERALEAALIDCLYFGQILVQKRSEGFILSHRDDEGREDLQTLRTTEHAVEIAKYDDTENYRPLKTAPNLRHGWRLILATPTESKRALDYFYPGRLGVFGVWKSDQLQTTPLRETLERQSGMYRVAAKISDEQIDNLVGNFCRSGGGCLRTILWTRDQLGTIASTKLPKEKFDPSYDQVSALNGSGQPAPTAAAIPLLCQEPCNLLVAECRKVVKGE